MQNKAIGIIGGSFDPIHLGHLHLASQMQVNYELSKVLFIPCHQNPLKTTIPHASAEDRIQMLQLATSPFKDFLIDLREILNPKPSYTLDTLKSLRLEKPQTPFVFLMAFDTFAHLAEWKDWQELLEYTHLIVTNRPGHSKETLPPALDDFLKKKKSDQKHLVHQALGGYLFFETLPPQPPISSSAIRLQVAAHADISEWVPASIQDYICSHHLYSKK